LDIINQQLIVDQKTFLQHFLQRSDRTGMAVGVETRVPMLDIALVEFLNSLPGRSKVTEDGVTKKPLRAALSGVVSSRISSLPKQPFGMPMAPFLRSGAVAEMLNDLLLTNPRSGPLFPVSQVQDLVREIDQDPNLWIAVWQLLTTEIWLREFKVAI
jgi:asparagine synthase (glutamine-hydrolysing)